QHLATIIERESVVVEPAALELLARAAQGSVRDALSLLEQALASGETPLGLEAARRALGLTDPATLHRLMRALAGSDAAAALCADLAAVAPSGFWLSALDLIATAEMNLRQPVDARLQAELCLLRLVRPPSSGDTAELFAALEARLGAVERAVQGARPANGES